MLDYPSKSTHDDIDVRLNFQNALKIWKNNPKSKDIEPILIENIKKGCSDSMVLLGDIYIDGTEEEKKKSLKLFMDAAEMGNSSGMRNTGYCLAIGLCCERNKEKAAEWYIRAGDAGNARAQCNIGVMYDFGNGVTQNFEEAIKWFKRSAEGGYPRGMTNLGIMYLEGKGTEKDPKEAEKWFKRSSSPRALYRLSMMYLDGLGIERDEDIGMTYLSMAADAKNSKAMCRLATIKENEDMKAAISLYREAAEKRNEDAIKRLAEMGLPIRDKN